MSHKARQTSHRLFDQTARLAQRRHLREQNKIKNNRQRFVRFLQRGRASK
jgi:hypothetical protein